MNGNRMCLVLDANDGPCVRSLFNAVGQLGWRVVLQQVVTPLHMLTQRSMVNHIRQEHSNIWKEVSLAPGFTRFRPLSESCIRWRRRAIEKQLGKPDIIFYTMPRYCRLAEDEKVPKAYFAYDPYKLYHGWDRDATEAEEERMLDAVDIRFSVSRQICEDWQASGRKCFYIPNAVDEGFVSQCRQRGEVRPADLAVIPGPVVGCVGHINRTYDWVLVERLAREVPDASFVFVGEVTESTPQTEDLRRMPNVFFLGWKQPSELAGYVAAFDVCLNPLTVNEMNNRRCPLRLFTYLAAEAPIVSTGIREAVELAPQVSVGADHGECVALVRAALAGEVSVDVQARQQFVSSRTWSRRAHDLVSRLDSIVFAR